MTTEAAADIDDALIGGNPSAEEAGEQLEQQSAEPKCNIVIQNRLESTGFDKKQFSSYIKGYCKKLVVIKIIYTIRHY